MKTIKKIIPFCFYLLLGLQPMAQTNIDSVKADLGRINEYFDSATYLAFDVDITTASDTLFGKFTHDETPGKYIISDKSIYYNLGTTEYMQNDSFVVMIYHDEKTMFVTRDTITAKSSLFPLKRFADSVISLSQQYYDITQYDDSDSRVIEFNARDSSMGYTRFAVYYSPDGFYLNRLEMSFPETHDPADPDNGLDAVIFHKKITMSFSNYSNPGSLDVFNNANYVYFDRLHKSYGPSTKFRGYRFIIDGFPGGDSDEATEIYPPPDNNQ